MKDNALYLEVDEDITSAIDKLKKSSASSVQIVVPKRSGMLQSIINLKLLKKAAESSGKELVLVTNDRIATELAGRVGLAVAQSVGAKAVIAEIEMPEGLKNGEEVIEAGEADPTPAQAAAAQAYAEATPPKTSKRPPLIRKRELTDEPPVAPVPAPPDSALAALTPDTEALASGPQTGKRPPKVPNFKRMQRRVMWVGAAVLLVALYTGGMYLFSTAKVTLYANGTKFSVDTSFTVDPTVKQSDDAGEILAGQLVSVTKDLTGPFTPTGQKDVGTKATGTMTISNCLDNNSHTFVSGTRFQAPDGKIFRSTADIIVPGGQGSFLGCTTPGTASVSVTADQNGDGYNEAPAAYTLPGLPASQQTGKNSISAQGAQMSGGTTKTVTIVTQADVDTEKAALIAADKDNSARDLGGKVPTGYTALTQSQNQVIVSTTPAPAVDAEGTTGSLDVKITYSMLAVKTSDYEALLKAQEQKQIGDQNQVYDDGLSTAQVTTTGDRDPSGKQTFHLTADAFSGAKIDLAQTAKALSGKRYGDAADAASRLPGVSRADISIWPGWATNLPSRTGKIKIIIQVANNKG